MPITSFTSLPPDARVWVFATDRALTSGEERALLDAVDAYLGRWQAHGSPLRCAREWLDHRFLAIGVDPTAEQASGCSIDGLFRQLRELEGPIGTRLVGGGRVFYRDAAGAIHTVTRPEFAALAARGEVTPATMVFDTSLTSARDWREHFACRAADTWTAELLAIN